jgi:2-keto-4-pentenoate hydratase
MSLLEQARQQLADYDRHCPGTLFAANSQSAMTVDDSYRLQMEVARLRDERGEPVAGYKIGCISPVMQAQLGLDRPVFGHIYSSELHCSGAMLDPSQYDGLAIEGEFGIRLAQDIPSVEWLLSHRDEAVGAGFAVIELHNYVFRNSPHAAQELIGNNAIHAGVVLPPEETRIQSLDVLLDQPLSVWKNGERLGTATGRALPEGPFGSLVRLVEHLARFGRGLHRGQLILTGSPLGLYRVADGDSIEVVCDRLGGRVRATVSLAAAEKG